jgi:hypothetical protein
MENKKKARIKTFKYLQFIFSLHLCKQSKI